MKCGLLGEKLGHSYSPQIHRELANYEYRLYEKRRKMSRISFEMGTGTG